MSSSNEQSGPPTQESRPLSPRELMDLAVRLVLALMRSASTEQISPMDWWPRAKSALLSGTATQDFETCVSRMAEKLQIETLQLHSARETSSIGAELDTVAKFEAFRACCQQKALYVVAMAQTQRDLERQRQPAREYIVTDSRQYRNIAASVQPDVTSDATPEELEEVL